MTDRRLVTAEVRALLEAADYIEEHGHAQRTYEDRDGSVCMLGAVTIASRDMVPGTYRAAVARLRRHLNVGHVVAWNDAEGRTQAEVVGALRAAATL